MFYVFQRVTMSQDVLATQGNWFSMGKQGTSPRVCFFKHLPRQSVLKSMLQVPADSDKCKMFMWIKLFEVHSIYCSMFLFFNCFFLVVQNFSQTKNTVQRSSAAMTGTVQSLLAVAAGIPIPFRCAVLRVPGLETICNGDMVYLLHTYNTLIH